MRKLDTKKDATIEAARNPRFATIVATIFATIITLAAWPIPTAPAILVNLDNTSGTGLA